MAEALSWFWQTFGLKGILFIGVVLLIAFRKYWTALLYDYVIDGAFSLADEWIDPLMDITVVGSPIPWEIGDLLAAFLIYRKEKHITGTMIAFIAAAEALSFGIEPLLEMIPAGSLIAAPVGMFFNLFPTVTLFRMIFGKTDRAIADMKLLDAEVSLAKETRIDIREEDEVCQKMHAFLRQEWPLDAIELFDKERPDKTLLKKLQGAIDTRINQTKSIITSVERSRENLIGEAEQAVGNAGFPDPGALESLEELRALFESQVTQAKNVLNQSQATVNSFISSIMSMLGSPPSPEQLKKAYDDALYAQQIIVAASREFDEGYRRWITMVRQAEQDMDKEQPPA
ncbi:hypothetical protein J4460_02475 [Candidatus Woesearchaeota archaeon]|nr:MAG: hypothetical protein QS99_C0004G0057 [archaeon GW2011_AR4]MBS3129515.1 hypothetical protein [Candidatus Woesearchaeota archaeon]HIH38896.1 hypothetical protein [Candidatus Woesearchaeota archaeon]HIH48302.1 hypothetical protein [Candidatus Woesearchaeota archaeon]HIJ03802.1 hypothetical protein [Candidatus Woesearchaeota archaeon]